MKKLLILFILFGCFLSIRAQAIVFPVANNLDVQGQSARSVEFLGETNYLKVYIDSNSWQKANQKEIYSKIYDLVIEFNTNIYPMITNVYGKSNIQGKKFNLILTPIKNTHEAYFIKDFNNIYLDVDSFYQYDLNEIYYFLSHEFMHIVSQYEKEDKYGIKEDLFFEEGRAEYTETLLGYVDNTSTNLQTRIRDFVNCNNPSFVNFDKSKEDYAAVNLFTNYLVEHYGMDILVDSFRSDKTGVDSINYALEKNGYEIRFNDIYLDWLVASYVNDCAISKKYCYFNQAFKNVTLIPYNFYVPTNGEVSLSTTKVVKQGESFFEKIVGGNGDVVLGVSNILGNLKKVPYVIIDKNEKKEIGFLDLQKNNEIKVKDFGNTNIAIVLIFSSFDDLKYTWQIKNNVFNNDIGSIQEVDFQIGEVENEFISILLRYIDLLKLKLELLKTRM